MRQKEILPSATTLWTWRGVMLSEISPTEKDTYRMVSLTHGIQKEKSNS